MPRQGQKVAALFARWLFLSFILIALFHATSSAQQSASPFIPRDETPEDFPPGPGREDTFYSCTACHGFKLVAQQRMNRRQWEDSINLMVAKHNMPPLPTKTRETVLNYLEATFHPGAQPRWHNPFLNR